MKQEELRELAGRCADRIRHAQPGATYFEAPYKHLVIDGFLSAELAQRCLDAFPPRDAECWEHSNDEDVEIKSRTAWTSEFDIPDHIIDAVRLLNSAHVLSAMGERMGIPKLVPDPYFSGGGLNVTAHGGLLDVHVDGNYHDATGLNRRLNALLYLNPGWEKHWGGELGLYDAEGRECVKRIEPLFNRLVVFDTHDFSFHGLPNPINFPQDRPRRSIILYYYTKAERPSHQTVIEAPHSALWVKRGLMDKRGKKTREFY
jgi:hypothetical protein